MPRKYIRKTDRGILSDNRFRTAQELVQNGCSTRFAAKVVGASVSGLRKRLEYGVVAASLGRHQTFTKEQENDFVGYCLRVKGPGVRRHDLRVLAFEYATSNNIKNQFVQASGMAGYDWVRGFLKRHPEIRGSEQERNDKHHLLDLMPRHRQRKTDRGTKGLFLYEQAYEEVSKGLSFRAAARMFDLNHVSLIRYKHKKENALDGQIVTMGYNTVNKIFTKDQEDFICNYSIRTADVNIGLSPKEVRRLAFDLSKNFQISRPKSWDDNQLAGEEWFYGFMKRHPELDIRCAQSLERATSSDKSNVESANLATGLDHDKSEPQDINMDETRVTAVQKQARIVTRRIMRQSQYKPNAPITPPSEASVAISQVYLESEETGDDLETGEHQADEDDKLAVRKIDDEPDETDIEHSDPIKIEKDCELQLAEFQADEEMEFGSARAQASPRPPQQPQRVAASAPPPLPQSANPMFWPEEPQPQIRPGPGADECQIFGDFVASELRTLRSEKSRKRLKRIIQKAILNIGEEEDVNIING